MKSQLSNKIQLNTPVKYYVEDLESKTTIPAYGIIRYKDDDLIQLFNIADNSIDNVDLNKEGSIPFLNELKIISTDEFIIELKEEIKTITSFIRLYETLDEKNELDFKINELNELTDILLDLINYEEKIQSCN